MALSLAKSPIRKMLYNSIINLFNIEANIALCIKLIFVSFSYHLRRVALQQMLVYKGYFCPLFVVFIGSC